MKPLRSLSAWVEAVRAGERAATVLVLCVIYVLSVAAIDLATPARFTFGIFYLVGISLAAWFVGRRAGLSLSVVACLFWLYVEHRANPHSSNLAFYWNFASRLAIFFVVAFAFAKIRGLQDSLESKVRERTQQLDAEIAQREAVEREVAAISHREQERIGHDLHDGLGQYLAGIAFRAKALEQSLAAEKLPQAADAAELTGLVSDAIKQARQLARGLAPIDLENGDLVPALQRLAVEVQNVFKVQCVFQPENRETPVRVDTETGLALYHICQEALHNAAAHGEPRKIEVSLALRDQRLHLSIRDNGKGCPADRQIGEGMGLRIMKYRARGIGADLNIISAPNEGTEIRCSVDVRADFSAATDATHTTPPANPAPDNSWLKPLTDPASS